MEKYEAATLKNLKEFRKESITTDVLFEKNKERIQLRSANNLEHAEREITDKNTHRPGLALAGFVELFTYHRVQIIGNTEVNYLRSLSAEDQLSAWKRLFEFEIPCIVVTNGHELAKPLLDVATENNVPVFISQFETTKVIFFVSDFLDDQFAPQTVIHGAFLDVYGIGLLFIGRSGIGKSEIALDLIERGHRLVADDVVIATRKGEGILMGSGTDLVKHFMEVRGLGLIDIRSIFGIRSIRFQKRIEVIVQLEEWDDSQEYTRTGLDAYEVDIMDVNVPLVRLPIFPGKNVTVISEVIALNYLLKHYGYDPAMEFSKRLQQRLEDKAKKIPSDRVIDWFEHDFE
ncbi:MAG: HPr kinase/phosphorylase [Ectothiorhodospiraceae bacterium]|nr:HPr kinase/phosphorylase [Ectothiorhodospiraceae bacterium]